MLVADEIGSIVALMDSKQSKKFVADLTAIIQRGRSVGVSVIASTQDPSTDTLPQRIRQQFATKVLLDLQTLTFKEWHSEKLQRLETLKISEGSILATD